VRRSGELRACKPWESPDANPRRASPATRMRSFTAVGELHKRRTRAELEALLAEVLAGHRADPPRGWPK
jgi:hypothetical protein